jgi:PST family polysaccharide transporter/lipopolysaccharide exporter
LPGGGTAERAVKSGIWAVATNALARSLYFGRLVVLAALLAPADFGLMGIATLTVAALSQLTRLGVDQALIQRTETDVDRFLDTVWTAKIARGVCIAIALFFGAPLVAGFFSEPRAIPLLRVIGVLPLLEGLANPGIVYFEKDLQFHKRLVHRVSGALAEALVAIAIALAYRSVWALVVGAVVGECTRLLVSYAIHRYRPRIAFDRALAGALFSYGKWITGLSVLVFATNSGDDVFVGWLLGTSALGLYQFAYQISNAPATEVSKLISSVVFPAYAKVQEDTARLREGYFKTLQLTAFLSFPIAVGIVITTPTFVRAFLGTQWLPAVAAIQVLAVWGLVRSLGSTSGPLFQAVGRPDYSTKIQLGKVLIIAALIWPATARFGIEGTAAVIVLNSLVFSEPLVYYLAMETIEGSYRRLARVLVLPGVASALMGLVVLAARDSLSLAPPTEFVVLVALGVLTYGALALLVERRFEYGMENVLRTMIEAVRS